MKKLVLFNKPFQVMCQFTDKEGRQHLGHFVAEKGVYAAGRLDYDSEGLLLLTDDGPLQNRITSSQFNKVYLVQVEGLARKSQLDALRKGVKVQDYMAKAVDVALLHKKPSFVWKRTPPIRARKNKPTSWVEVTLNQGKNRQVRRMMAAVGLPVLRLIRTQIGEWKLDGLGTGEKKIVTID
ncbi:pseudouridine synthase [Marinicella rhabdoformis]|uniref:pseudouridine synthase n=1 Tax=Marinicella rhabdoformis TaxID=2580566 RepID=UPI0012AECBA1|nr:pseudouridine synthase [Marinicella rhabdoformis]